jgi:predicted AAA+ superfamily ATPase
MRRECKGDLFWDEIQLIEGWETVVRRLLHTILDRR